MSPSLLMINTELEKFKNGSTGLESMWAAINHNLENMRKNKDVADPFEDDKAERRYLPAEANLL